MKNIIKTIIKTIIILITFILVIPIGLLSKIPMILVWGIMNTARGLLVVLRVDPQYYYFSLREAREYLSESLIDMF